MIGVVLRNSDTGEIVDLRRLESATGASGPVKEFFVALAVALPAQFNAVQLVSLRSGVLQNGHTRRLSLDTAYGSTRCCSGPLGPTYGSRLHTSMGVHPRRPYGVVAFSDHHHQEWTLQFEGVSLTLVDSPVVRPLRSV